MITIAQHTAQIDMVAELYKKNSGEDKFSVMSDVLADLLLWSRTNAIDFADALRLGVTAQPGASTDWPLSVLRMA